jgi:hypothetical protein
MADQIVNALDLLGCGPFKGDKRDQAARDHITCLVQRTRNLKVQKNWDDGIAITLITGKLQGKAEVMARKFLYPPKGAPVTSFEALCAHLITNYVGIVKPAPEVAEYWAEAYHVEADNDMISNQQQIIRYSNQLMMETAFEAMAPHMLQMLALPANAALRDVTFKQVCQAITNDAAATDEAKAIYTETAQHMVVSTTMELFPTILPAVVKSYMKGKNPTTLKQQTDAIMEYQAEFGRRNQQQRSNNAPTMPVHAMKEVEDNKTEEVSAVNDHNKKKNNKPNPNKNQNTNQKKKTNNKNANKKQDPSKNVCFLCGATGHWQSQCPVKLEAMQILKDRAARQTAATMPAQPQQVPQASYLTAQTY